MVLVITWHVLEFRGEKRKFRSTKGGQFRENSAPYLALLQAYVWTSFKYMMTTAQTETQALIQTTVHQCSYLQEPSQWVTEAAAKSPKDKLTNSNYWHCLRYLVCIELVQVIVKKHQGFDVIFCQLPATCVHQQIIQTKLRSAELLAQTCRCVPRKQAAALCVALQPKTCVCRCVF